MILGGCSKDSEQTDPKKDPNDENAPGVEEIKDPTEGGTLRVGVLQLPSWNPFKWQEAAQTYSTAEQLVYRGLFTYSPDQQLVPDLIKSYAVDEGVDGKSVLRFTLDDKAIWHDGTPITFEDINFTLHTYLDPFYYGAWKQNLSYIDGTSAFRSGKKEQISGIKQDENGDIVMELTNATSSFYHALTAPILPAHQLKGLSSEEIAQQFETGKVVGNGQFQFETKSDQELSLTRVIAYADGGPYLEGISFQVYNGDVATASGQYDLLAVPPQTSEPAEGFKAYDVALNQYFYLGFNMEDDVVGKSEVRTAIAEAADRQALIDAVLFGHGTAVDRIIPNNSWLSEGTTSVDTAKLDAAINRMTTLGYSPNKQLKLTVLYQGDNRLVDKVVDALSQQLSSIYIKIEKKPLNGDEYYAYLFSGKPTQAFIHAWPFTKDIGYWWKLYGTYHDVKDLGLNIFHYSNDKVDEYSKRLYMRDTASKGPMEDGAVIIKQLQTDLPLIPLFSPNQSYWVSKRLHDQNINGDGFFLDISKWWLEK